MTARLIKEEELPQLLSVALRTFVDTYAHLNDPQDFDVYLKENFTIERIKSEFDTKGCRFYFIENENKILGYMKLNFDKTPSDSVGAMLYDNTLSFKEENGVEIERIYVLPEQKGNGIGRFMMETVEKLTQEYYANQPLRHIWLGVWSENYNAFAFYEKMGFNKIGEHIFTIGSEDQIDYLMIKKL